MKDRLRTLPEVATYVGDRLLTLPEVADYIGVPLQTLYGWRSRGEAPRGITCGRHVRVRRSDLERWLEEHADEAPSRTATANGARQGVS
jgi:excisionase family DNA binding protein